MTRAGIIKSLVASALALCVGCGPDIEPQPEAGGCEPVPSPGVLPAHLSETAFFCGDRRAFEPGWPLWTDGLEKERFLILPPGAVILARDAGDWDLPIGARLFKTVLVEGEPVETRVSWRMEDGWKMGAYLWSGDEAVHVPEGAELDNYEVPAASSCLYCHGAVEPEPMAFNGWQLLDAPVGLSTAGLIDEGVLRGPGTDADLSVPGDEVVRAGLGYLAANCAGCHSADGLAGIMSEMRLGLELPMPGSLEDSLFFTTTVNVPASDGSGMMLVVPGAPDESRLLQRMMATDGTRMPAFGSAIHDDEGIAAIRALIETL